MRGGSHITAVAVLTILVSLPAVHLLPNAPGTDTGSFELTPPEDDASGPTIRDGQESYSFPLPVVPDGWGTTGTRVCYDADRVEVGSYVMSGEMLTIPTLDHFNLTVGYAYRELVGQQTYTGWYRSLSFQSFDSAAIGNNLPSYSKGVAKVELVLSPTADSNIGEVGVFRVSGPWKSQQVDTGYMYPPDTSVDWSHTYDVQTPSKGGEYYRWNITALVDEWISGTYKNYGICLASTDAPSLNAPAPGGSEPRSFSANLKGNYTGQAGGPPSGTVCVYHYVNDAPVATIDSIEPSDPMPGQTVFLNGSVTDPDGDGITKYKWWTEDGLLAEGPDADRVTTKFSKGAFTIYFSALDSDPGYSRWSNPDSKVIIVELPVTQAPTVISTECLVNGISSSTIAEKETAEFIIGDRWDRSGFQGTITIMGTSIIINHEPMIDNGDGTYSYFWSTTGVTTGEYSVDFTLIDPITGLEDPDGLIPGPDMTLTIMDTTPPSLKEVKVTTGLEDGVVQPGETVSILAIEESGESGLNAHISIDGPMQLSASDMADRGSGLYEFNWDTSGWPEGDYGVDVTLEDDFSNEDTNGVDDMDPDLIITIRDTRPPEVLSVMFLTKDDMGNILVQVANQEEGLEGTVYMDGPEYLEFTLYGEGDGLYNTEIELSELYPGQYGVEIVVWDKNGNTDIDGLDQSPDLEFVIVAPNDPPVIENRYPSEGAVLEPGIFPVEVTFSEEITYPDSLDWAVQVWNGIGEPVSGKVTLTGDGRVLRFTPNMPWISGDYTVVISSRLTDSGGLAVESNQVWKFTVQGTGTPIALDGSSPVGDPETEPGETLVLNVSIPDAERIEWWVNGKLEGEGSNFTFVASDPGFYGIAAVGVSGGDAVVMGWQVTVSPPPDTSDEDDTEVTDGEDDSGSNTLAGGVLGAMGAVLIVIALLLFLRPGKGGTPQQGKQAAVGRDAAKVTTPQAAGGREAARVTTPQTVMKGPAPVVRKEAPRRDVPHGPQVKKQASGTTAVRKVQ